MLVFGCWPGFVVCWVPSIRTEGPSPSGPPIRSDPIVPVFLQKAERREGVPPPSRRERERERGRGAFPPPSRSNRPIRVPRTQPVSFRIWWVRRGIRSDRSGFICRQLLKLSKKTEKPERAGRGLEERRAELELDDNRMVWS